MNNISRHPRNLFKAIQAYINPHRRENITFRNTRTLAPDENLYGNMIFCKFQGDSSSLNAWPLLVTALSCFQSFLNNKLSSVIPYTTWDNAMIANPVTNHLLFWIQSCYATSVVYTATLQALWAHCFFYQVHNTYTIKSQLHKWQWVTKWFSFKVNGPITALNVMLHTCKSYCDSFVS